MIEGGGESEKRGVSNRGLEDGDEMNGEMNKGRETATRQRGIKMAREQQVEVYRMREGRRVQWSGLGGKVGHWQQFRDALVRLLRGMGTPKPICSGGERAASIPGLQAGAVQRASLAAWGRGHRETVALRTALWLFLPKVSCQAPGGSRKRG